MSAEPEHPGTRTGPRAASEPTSHLRAEGKAQERADVAEDRRRQRDLDDAELGGEA